MPRIQDFDYPQFYKEVIEGIAPLAPRECKEAFYKSMETRIFGYDAVTDAWAWFREGWKKAMETKEPSMKDWDTHG